VAVQHVRCFRRASVLLVMVYRNGIITCVADRARRRGGWYILNTDRGDRCVPGHNIHSECRSALLGHYDRSGIVSRSFDVLVLSYRCIGVMLCMADLGVTGVHSILLSRRRRPRVRSRLTWRIA
jgi:hypothetical protein